MLFNPVKVSLVAFAILFKIHSAYCGRRWRRSGGGVAAEQLFTAAAAILGSLGNRPAATSTTTILVYTKKRKGTSYGLGRPGAEHFYSPLLWGQPCNSSSISTQGQLSTIEFSLAYHFIYRLPSHVTPSSGVK